jgi:plastocyanin
VPNRTYSLGAPHIALLALTAAAVIAAGILGWNAVKAVNRTSPSPAPPIYGTVSGEKPDATSLTIETGMGETASVRLDRKTTYSIVNATPFNSSSLADLLNNLVWGKAFPGQRLMPGMSETHGIANALGNLLMKGAFQDINGGDFVIAEGMREGVSPRVYVFKFASNIKFAAGTISGISNSGLVITPPSPAFGPAFSLGWDDNSRFFLKGLQAIQVGQDAAVIFDSSTNMVEIAFVASPSFSPHPSSLPVPTTSERESANIELAIQNSRFSPAFIMVPAGSEVSILFSNQDAALKHNFSIYNNRNATTAVFRGAELTGPGSILYEFIAPDISATYYFRCDLHPEENGQFMVGDIGD